MITEIETLDDLKKNILTMSGLVERALDEAVNSLKNKSTDSLDLIFKKETEVNKYHKIIDQGCLELIATLSPFATDLRRILAGIKINNDLERMGDLTVNIAKCVKFYLTRKEIPLNAEMLKLAQETQKMVKKSLDAYVRENLDLAKEVIKSDDHVDELKRNIMNAIKEKMSQDPDMVASGVDFIAIAQSLERMADHATNIAEDIIFILSGDDVRHPDLK